MKADSKTIRSVMLLQIVVAIIWGGTWVAGRIAASEVPALAMAGIRIVLAMVTLIALVWREEGKFPLLPRTIFPTVVLMGLTGIFGYAVCFCYGLKYINAGQGALVVALTPVCVALCSWAFMGEALGRKKILGIAIALYGCLMVIGHGHPLEVLQGHISKGQFLIVGCVVCWTTYTLLGRRASGSASSLVITMYATLIGGTLLLILGLVEGSLRVWPAFSWKGWLAMFFLGCLGNSLAYVWHAQGLKVLGATRTSVFTNIVPISAVCLGALILHESIELMTLFGGILVMLGVWLTNHVRR